MTCLQGADLKDAHLKRTDFSHANLKETKNLIINQLYEVKTLYKAELDESLRALLKKKYPALFEVPNEFFL